MRKFKKRVIAIITCCFVLATFCVGVFADEIDSSAIIDPNMNRVGTITSTTPFDLGDLVHAFTNNDYYVPETGYYILKVNHETDIALSVYLFNIQDNGNVYFVASDNTNSMVRPYFNFSESSYISNLLEGVNYIYVYIDNPNNLRLDSFTESNNYVELYSIANRSVIDSVYANSQDVNSSIVNVINEATNVITTNDVVMMFCILIPVISFGVGILIRLRKRA